MSDNRTLYVEEAIIGAVKRLLTEQINELLGDIQKPIPIIEFSNYRGGSVVVPVINLSTCERSEKERIVRLDAYSLSITFTLPETPESELYCYAYAGAVGRALYDNPTLDGVVDRAVVSGKKYVPPKKAYGGNEWEIVISLRITIEGMGNVG